MDTQIPGEIPTEIPVIDMTESPRRSSKTAKPNIVAAGLAIVLSVGGGLALLADRSGTTTATSTRLPKLKLGSIGAAGAMESRSAMMPFFDYKYTHTGQWPTLASTGPVYKLVGPAVDSAEATRIAAALGVNGKAQSNDKGWLISEGERQVSIAPGEGGFSVALYNNGGMSVSGSTGSVGSAGDDVTTSPEQPADDQPAEIPTKTTVPATEPSPRPEPEPLPEPLPEPEPMPVPENLPSDSEAISIAQKLIEALSIDAPFEYEAFNAGAVTVGGTCDAAEKCRIDTPAPMLYSRSVLAHRLVDGHRVSGLTWSFEIGDNGVVQSAYGTIANLEKMGDYPLRSIPSVYDDIVAGTFYGGQPMPLGAAEVRASVERSISQTGSDDNAVAPPAPSTPGVDPTCLAKECVLPEPDIAPDISVPNDSIPDTTIAPVISTVNVTGVTISSQVWYGFDGTTSTTYIVPMYSFAGTVTSTDNPGSPWTSDYIALDQSFIDSTTPPTPPSVGDDPTVTIEPQPGVIKPGTGSGGEPVEPIEPAVEPVKP